MVKLHRGDIQGIIFSAYSHLACASYLLLRIEDAAATRRWLSGIADKITKADGKKEVFSINLALTYCGLRKLGLNEATLNTFPIAFREGGASQNRSRILGDTNNIAPSAWDWGGDPDSIHILQLVYGKDAKSLNEQLGKRKAEIVTSSAPSLVREPSSGRPP